MTKSAAWKLKRTRQCEKCPWRVAVDPRDIPAYSEAKHRALEKTIARGPLDGCRAVMACHETEGAHCIGWLVNQVGPGNNVFLRLAMTLCENGQAIRLRGEQHATFEDTLPPSNLRKTAIGSEIHSKAR